MALPAYQTLRRRGPLPGTFTPSGEMGVKVFFMPNIA
jgi:hypothetical protein